MRCMKVTIIAFVVFVPLLASCATLGLYNMSDDWCAAHRDASAARCPTHQERVVHNDSDRATAKATPQSE
jgi:hypothetical protein